VPSNTLHGVVALDDGVLLDVFTPQRQDFLE
jgi:quercetin dioxygenase-like cupin family protein